MSRKNFDDEDDKPDRWLVSYADFITLLFAFFVVMYSISAVNEGKYRVLSRSLGTAFGQKLSPATEMPGSTTNNSLPSALKSASPLRNVEAEQMNGVAKDLSQVLDPLVQQGVIRVSQSSRGVDIEINASLLFASGAAKLTEESLRVIGAIAAVLNTQRYDLEIDGYSDDQPISSPLFPSNWELSAVRASSVARQLVSDGIAENRLRVVGFGSNNPILPNDTPENRARNRRVELVILSPHYEAAKEVSYQTGTSAPK